VKVRIDPKTENYRLLSQPSRVEMILAPISEGDTAQDAQPAAEDDSPEVAAIALRIMNAVSADFHAEQVVPLSASGQGDA
jgi:hypothetical protein